MYFSKRYTNNLFKYLTIIALYCFLLFKNCSIPSIWEYDGFACFTIAFSYITPKSYTDIVNFIITIFPTIWIIYCYSDYMLSDFMTNYIYVFTRMGTKRNWLIKKCRSLLFELAGLYLSLFIMTFIFSIYFGYNFNNNGMEMLRMLLSLYILNLLFHFLIIFIVNIMSLALGSHKVFFITTIIYMSMLILSMVFYGNNNFTYYFTTVSPLTQHMYYWHDNIVIPIQLASLSEHSINNFNIIKSICLLIIYIVITYIFSYRFINKNDLSSIIGEDVL